MTTQSKSRLDSSQCSSLLKDFCSEQFEHPQDSWDFAPSNYYLFPRLKKEFGRKYFQVREELIAIIRNICTILGKIFIAKG